MAQANEQRHRPLVGRQIRRRRQDRGLTLSGVSALTGLNVGYLSQVENDKASPSLETLASLAAALDVPIAWFLLDTSVPPRVVRAGDRPIRTLPQASGSVSQVDGGIARDMAIFEGSMAPGSSTGFHAHPGDEHHVVLEGRIRIRQGDAVVDAGPGDYVLLDGTLPHDAEALGDEPARLLIVYPRGGHSELTTDVTGDDG
ncbi:MAG TPA: XRE family transcriptional regulator [Candidatus Limnocylindria bacterium]|jgi:transcriptional regulator with XRE-family HTH domain|nr:XRE family transcriptional regulator [Candidatus Limnocylindria bacterium]